jgi:hypothetical protein
MTFTQFLRPDGRKVPMSVKRPADVEALAAELQRHGIVFEAEILATDDVALYASRPDDDEDGAPVAVEVVPNGRAVHAAVDRLVRDAHAVVVRS